MKELISVIIPAYNRASTIKRCIESVQKQTYDNIEIIVVDDGSIDNTKQVVESIVDGRVVYLSYKDNRGACYARNYGVKNAHGDIIAFQDSDDFWIPEKLEKQYKFMMKGDYDFVFCGMKRQTVKGKNISYPLNKKAAMCPTLKSVLIENCASTQTMMMKKKVAEDVGFDNKIKKYQDWDFMLRVVGNYKIGFINEDLLISEISNNSISKVVDPLPAIEVIFNKYRNYILSDNVVYAAFLARFGDARRLKDPSKAKGYYKDSLKKHFKIKVFVKYLYCVEKVLLGEKNEEAN